MARHVCVAVAWLHVRLDDSLKYCTYAPYRTSGGWCLGSQSLMRITSTRSASARVMIPASVRYLVGQGGLPCSRNFSFIGSITSLTPH